MVPSRGWSVVPVVATLLVCSLLVPGAAAAVAPEERAAAHAGEPSLATQDFQADRTEFRVTVFENGSAKWVFQHEQGLDSEEERQDFQSFAEEFNENETELYTNFQRRARALADNGSEATGRDMSAGNFQRNAETRGFNDNLGVVEMSFLWEGFAATSDGRVVVGDIFQGGLYLSEDQRFVVRTGEGMAFQSVDPEDDAQFSDDTPADSTYVTWQGERSFTDNRPRIVLVPEDDVTTRTDDDDDDGAPGTDPGWILPMGALFVVVLLGLGAAVAYRAGMFPPDDDAVATDVDEGGGGGGAGDAAVAAAGAGAGAADAETASGAGAAGVSEEELISDEERVVNLLEDNGGRMKQVNIVDETGWSKSKVSMLLSDMEEEETISKLRVGRENIVSLSGQEPDAAGSPFEDED